MLRTAPLSSSVPNPGARHDRRTGGHRDLASGAGGGGARGRRGESRKALRTEALAEAEQRRSESLAKAEETAELAAADALRVTEEAGAR